MSDQWFSLVMYVIMLPVLIIMCAVLSNETKPKKNIILGVTLPYSAQTDPEVQALCGRFRKALWLWAVPLALLGVPMFFIPWFSVQFTAYMLWMMVVIIVPYILYVKAHLRLKKLKGERGWYIRRQSPAETVVDLSVAAAPRKQLSPWWFIPPFAISLVPTALAYTRYAGEDMTAWVIVSLAFAGTVLLSWILYPIIFRLRTDVAGSDTRVNAALTNARRANWGRTWIYIAWTTALMGLCAWFFRNNELGQLITILCYTFVLMRLCIWTEMGLRREQERLTAAANADYIDEDEHWPLGMFYNNPHDSHLTVNARVGMNMTVNLAKPVGRFIMGLTALILVLLPFTGVWVMGVEFSPIRAEVTEERVEVVHLTRQFRLSLDDIESAELIEELPRTARINGTGMDSLREGRFSVEGYGPCVICLHPDESPFIVLQTGDKTYIFNTETPEDTRDVFAKLRSEVNA